MAPSTPSDGIHILYVDDEPDYADMAGTFLEREDDRFTIETAVSASEGLDRLTEQSFDCVISDYDMPGQDGIDFLQAVRESYVDLPFILHTGKGSEEIASEAISGGVTDYLQKGSGTERYALLANRVSNAVEREHAEHRAEEREVELQRQNDLFSKAQDIAEIGAWSYDVRTGESYLTEKAYEIHGLAPDSEMTPEQSIEFYHPNDRPAIREAFERAVKEGEPYELELRLIDADDTERWVRTSGEPQSDDGSVVRVRGVLQDITEPKQREQELVEITQQHETIFNNTEEAIFLLDVEDGDTFRIAQLNPAEENLLGYSTEEVRGKTLFDLYDEETAEKAVGAYRRCVEAEEPIVSVEDYELYGSERPYETTLAPVISDGEVIQIVGVSREISDRNKRDRDSA